jgi:aryl-alcohol dehydrogenase-like predicted oxidoreductase
MPVSIVGALKSREFEKDVMPLCERDNIAVLGMKGFGGSRRTHLHEKTNVEEAVRYSLSYPQVCTHVIGVDKLDYVNQAVAAAPSKPMSSQERLKYAHVDNSTPKEQLALEHGGKFYEKGTQDQSLA